MSDNFLLVNQTKKQYLDADDLLENSGYHGIVGYQGAALGLLLLDGNYEDELVGSWAGDRLYQVSAYLTEGMETELSYANIIVSYQNISLQSLGMLFENGWVGIRDSLIEEAKKNPEILATLWSISTSFNCPELSYTLKMEFGHKKQK